MLQLIGFSLFTIFLFLSLIHIYWGIGGKWAIDRWGIKVMAALFLLRTIGDFKFVGFTRSIKNTPFASRDRKYYTPLCLLIAALLLIFQII